MRKRLVLFLLLLGTLPVSSLAWVYPEHRHITLQAILKLDPARRAELDRLWALARTGYEGRLGPSVADALQGRHPKMLDYAAFPAISGDHSISASDLLQTVLKSDWILNVADVAAQLKEEIDAAKNESERVAALRDSDLRFLRADPGYVSRAGANNVHFLLARTSSAMKAAVYFDSCFRVGTEINLVGTYIWYHSSALLKAGWLNHPGLTDLQRSELALSALADEAFALHFLEDAFSAGHAVGIWGSAALRKGTHDYYDEHGLEVTTWNGERLVLTGDAYIRPQDLDRAAASVILSLEQVLDASTGRSRIPAAGLPAAISADTLDVGKNMSMPDRGPGPVFRDLTDQVLLTTPIPGLAGGLGEIPRFRSEIGPFAGIAPAARLSLLSGGFGSGQLTMGVIPGLEVAAHIGLGLDGVLNETSDGLVFLDIGYRIDGASSIKIEKDPAYKYFGSILSAVPSREALYVRVRMPYYLIPGDLVLLGPILLVASPKALNNVIATAGAGGLIPWQMGLVTPLGRFQFILGREVGICFYGSFLGDDSFILTEGNTTDDQWNLISLRTTQIDIPVIEYRPIRTFSRKQSASMVFQLAAGVDIPGKVTMLDPADAPMPDLKPIWSLGLRLSFDWRYYYMRR